jgi:hypothetical protein
MKEIKTIGLDLAKNVFIWWAVINGKDRDEEYAQTIADA